MSCTRYRVAGVVAAVCLVAAASSADGQWFKYPTPGNVPRTASGAVNMATLETTPTPHYRQFRVEFLDFAKDRREVELALAVSKPLDRERCEQIQEPAIERANIETEAQFWVGPFGFPMIDNTRLSRSERCSVSVIRILDNSVTVAISYFPASRASLKDKPYYDEVLQDLLRNPSAGAGR